MQDVFEDDTDVHMVMELCEGPSLTDSVSAGQLANEQDIAIVMSSILRFIAQCHGKGLVYRDVKPDNFIFVRNDFRSPLKATDFGLSIRHRTGESPLTSRSGTPAYMAPEVCCITFVILACCGSSSAATASCIDVSCLRLQLMLWSILQTNRALGVTKHNSKSTHLKL